MRNIWLLAGAIALTAAVACKRESRPPEPPATPEALAKAFVGAGNSGRAAPFHDLFVTDHVLDLAFDCGEAGDTSTTARSNRPPRNPTKAQFGTWRLDSLFAEFGGDAKYLGIETRASKIYAAGTRLGPDDILPSREADSGCTFKVNGELQRLRVNWEADGERRGETITIGRFDTAGWYLLAW